MRLRWLPPALLVAIFAMQVVLVRTSALTPWKGGGFGMFSTLDHGAYRRMSVIVNAPDRSERVEVAPSIEEEEARAVACPSDRLLRRLAVAVAERERRHERPVSSVAVTVWRVEFERGSLAPVERAIRTFVYDARR
jgi:hypothetical protein